MRVFCESQQGKKARPSGPPGGASLLVNRNDVRPRYAEPKGEFLRSPRGDAAIERHPKQFRV